MLTAQGHGSVSYLSQTEGDKVLHPPVPILSTLSNIRDDPKTLLFPSFRNVNYEHFSLELHLPWLCSLGPLVSRRCQKTIPLSRLPTPSCDPARHQPPITGEASATAIQANATRDDRTGEPLLWLCQGWMWDWGQARRCSGMSW